MLPIDSGGGTASKSGLSWLRWKCAILRALHDEARDQHLIRFRVR